MSREIRVVTRGIRDVECDGFVYTVPRGDVIVAAFDVNGLDEMIEVDFVRKSDRAFELVNHPYRPNDVSALCLRRYPR